MFFVLFSVHQLLLAVGASQSAHRAEEVHAASLSRQFQLFKEKVMRLVTSAEYADGIEIVAMLVTVDMLIANHEQCKLEKSAVAQTRNPSGGVPFGRTKGGVSLAPDIIGSLLESARNILENRLTEFLTAQIAWIKHTHEETKRSTVLIPFLKFPAFIDQLKEFAGDKVGYLIVGLAAAVCVFICTCLYMNGWVGGYVSYCADIFITVNTSDCDSTCE